MLIDDIFSSFTGESPQDYYNFETFALNILKLHIESQHKEFQLTFDRRIGDAIAINGFDDFHGSTIIEIKKRVSRRSIHVFLDEAMLFLPNQKNEISNVLMITAEKPTRANDQIIVPSNLPFNLTIWGPDELNKIVNKYKKKSQEIANNLFSLRLENAVANNIGSWENERDQKIELLTEVYDRGQFSLFLGAGVSSSAGMPDWNTLLNSLFVSYLTKEFNDDSNISDQDIKQIVTRLNNLDEPSALIAARYLRRGFSKSISEIKDFTKTITDNLYKLRNTTKKTNSDLIISIANLCMPRRTGAKVKSVITYNFDDLLEKQLDTKTIQSHSIYIENEAYDPDELPIYHVHGFLPEDGQRYERLDKGTLVFSEEGYHQIYSDSYHWSNLVQLSTLRENSCVMIGLSMTDPNLRRLLDISARNIDRPKHYAFMRRMTISRFAYENDKEETRLIKNLKGVEHFLNSHHKLNEEIMRELGVSIIWFNDFDEIPVILNKLSRTENR